MIAAKMMDPVMGIDIHIVQPPGPVPPLPIPHPFIGMVLDPMEMVPIVGATVMVNGMPRATAGTACKNIPPHIPIGGMFVKPPGNEAEVFMGSATVLADGTPFSFMAVPVLSCSDVGMPPPPRMSKKSKAKSLLLPTTVLMAIPMGMIVMVGGPPTIDMMALAMKAGMSALGKVMKKVKKGAKKVGQQVKKMAKKVRKAASNVVDSTRNAVKRAKCFVTGHPVDIPTGKVFTDQVDFEIEGPIPIMWERVWYSSSDYQGPLGHGWHHPYDMKLTLYPQEEILILRLNDGRVTAFPILREGESFYNRDEQMSLRKIEKGYEITDADQRIYQFEAHNPYEPLSLHLISIKHKAGFHIDLHYNQQGYLTQLIDSAGRTLELENDEAGRIILIRAPHPEEENTSFPIVQYAYDEYGNLTKATDALGHSFHYKYDFHLLVRETNRNGLSFYFEYDGIDHTAKCIRTWGDGGIHDHKLTYLEGITLVENSLGYKTSYHHNGALVTKIVDPKGNETYFQYNEFFDLISSIDPLGRETQYEYDEAGNQSKKIRPDGTFWQMNYEEGKLKSVIDPLGGTHLYIYDETGLLISEIDPLGRQNSYVYDNGLLTLAINGENEHTAFEYDADYNLIELTYPNQTVKRWKYDLLGRQRVEIDLKQNVERRHFDLQGNIIQIDGSHAPTQFFAYDAEGNLVKARKGDRTVTFTYQGLGKLHTRRENQSEVQFLYDTEEQLIGVRNEHRLLYEYELDENGNIELEKGFDQLRRYYQVDAAGRIKAVVRASGIESRYEYDEMDQVIAIKHFEGNKEIEGEYFSYREDGELVEARNAHSHIRLERDAIGQVVKEWNGDHWIASEFNKDGKRTGLSSLLGANIAFDRDVMGDVIGIHTSLKNTPWELTIERDEFGIETRSEFTGGLSSRWRLDELGRPLEQQIFSRNAKKKSAYRRLYQWDTQERLTSLQVSEEFPTRFTYDLNSKLVSAQYENHQFEYRAPDQVGNIFKNSSRSDRTYGSAGQLLKSDHSQYTYDEEGNLIEKIGRAGEKWLYEWYPSGNLKSVLRPDGAKVVFQYDALGRRLRKSSQEETTYWMWDGDVPLHEWTTIASPAQAATSISIEPNVQSVGIRISKRTDSSATADDPLAKKPMNPFPEAIANTQKPELPTEDFITWIFEPETYTPRAKLINEQAFNIVTDHLGTPVSMYAEKGELVWSAETSIYGELRKVMGAREELPFRYPGQYEDEETGLYYNRFRYYDPEMGKYISQDPIRLLGGINLYQYTPNPLKWIDPSGLAPVCRISGRRYSKASDMPIIRPGTKDWDNAVKALKKGGRGDVRVADHADAKRLLQESRGNMNRVKRYKPLPTDSAQYKKSYEVHKLDPNNRASEVGVGNDLHHIKWRDNGGKDQGHIFFED